MKSILKISTSKGATLFVCTPSKDLWSNSNCFYTLDDGLSWKGLTIFDICFVVIYLFNFRVILVTIRLGGAVADETVQDNRTNKIRALNQKIHKDERINLSLVPIADGLTLAMKNFDG